MTADADLLEIIRQREIVDRLSSHLFKSKGMFGETSVGVPALRSSSELAFRQIVSWLYVHYFELAKASIEFLIAHFESYGLTLDSKVMRHPMIVQSLRTYLEHNLSPTRPRDVQTQERCENWFNEVSGTIAPDTEPQWKSCVDKILAEARAFFAALEQTVRFIEVDESRNEISNEWRLKVKRDVRPEMFDPIIAVAAADLGREALDIVRFRVRNFEKWAADLQALRTEYDFQFEARRLVEKELLSDRSRVMPITGADLIASFSLQPGPLVGDILKCAERLYMGEPCSRERLLERIRDNCFNRTKE